MFLLQTLCRVGQVSVRSLRPMSAQKPTIAEVELQREKDIPKDLHPMFYKLKKDQKLYQVRISCSKLVVGRSFIPISI